MSKWIVSNITNSRSHIMTIIICNNYIIKYLDSLIFVLFVYMLYLNLEPITSQAFHWWFYANYFTEFYRKSVR